MKGLRNVARGLDDSTTIKFPGMVPNMGAVLRYILLGFSGAFIAMFAEPFFSELLMQAGIDTSRWAGPVMTFLGDLISQTWFQLLGIGVIGATIGAWADWVLRRLDRRKARQSIPSLPYDETLYSYDAAEGAPDAETYYALIDFTVQHLIPACESLIDLQKGIIRRLSGNPMVANFAIEGMESNPLPETRPFWKNFGSILHGIDSCDPLIKWDALVDCIRSLERGAYKAFRDQTHELAASSGIDMHTDGELAPLWHNWCKTHDELETQYDKIKNNPRFGRKLFRPLRDTRWGGRPEFASLALIQTKALASNGQEALNQEGGGKLPPR